MAKAMDHRIAWALGLTSVVLMIVGLVFTFVDRHAILPEAGDAWGLSHVFDVVVNLAAPVLGIVLVSRQRENPLGWLFLVAGLALGLGTFARPYALHAIVADPGALPLGRALAWLGNAVWPIPICLLVFLLLLFPTGTLVSARWRSVAWLAGALLVVLTALTVVFATVSWAHPFKDVIGTAGGTPADVAYLLFALVWFLLPAVALVACASVVVRYRRSRGEERLQLKWFAAAAALVAFALPVTVAINAPFTAVIFDVAVLSLFGAIGIAILRYRLYDIDVIINKAAVYAGLAAFVSVVYVLVVVVIGAFVGASEFLALVATAIVAVAFQPLRLRLQGVARRLVYGDRATPYETLSTFSERLAGTYSTDEILPRMARVLAEGTGATRGQVWLRLGSALRPAASWPDEDPRSGVIRLAGDRLPQLLDVGRVAATTREVEVRHQGQLLGALTVLRPPSEPFTPAEEKLLAGLASQAGLVLRNVGLIMELRASRQRLVSAQDEERRRIERNLHDGAQQQLVALAVKFRLIEGFARTDAEKVAELAREAAEETGDAVQNLRDLARGIYPPLLADKGLSAALASQAEKAPIAVSLDADGVDRYTQEAESTVYFCCLEALQNVAKYANASRARIRLIDERGTLRFEVSDDGAGFDPALSGYGSGLQGMADRLDAIGGSLDVRSAPGTGTIVTGSVPTQASELAR